MSAAKLKILAIDDGKDSLDALAAAVKHAFPGAVFFPAPNGLSGIELALAKDPDIILLDIVMPGMDGFETCRRLKADARLSHIPVVFLTALKPDKGTLEKAFAAGGDAFLLKPMELWELTAQIRTMLKNKAANNLQRTDHAQVGILVTQRTRELADELAAREKALESSKKSEELFRIIFAEAPIGIALIDSLTGHIYEVNRMFAAIVGRTMKQMLDIDWMSITHPDDVQKDLDNMALLNTGKISGFQMEKRYLKPDGTAVWVNMTIAPVKIGDKGNPRHLCLVEDKTAVKAAEQEKLKLEEQFRQSQKMETAGNLAGGIAHDFNNILTAILSYSDFLLKNPSLDGPCRADVEEIKKAGERATALTRQLLIFSRKQVLQPKVLDLNQIILGVKTMLGRLIGENIKLTTLTSKVPPLIKADPGYMEQVLLNLSINARDAMPEGGKITLEASIVRMDEAHIHRHGTVEPGNYVLLSVSDTGTGMSAETQSHLFEPFFTTKPRDKGTGLGLSTVHGIVKQSGGSIVVYSEEGRGTVFKLYFPQVAGKAAAAEPQAAVVKKMLAGTGTVLLVDDDSSLRAPIRRALTLAGFNVIEASSAEEALAACKKQKERIHLLLTDMVLPKMNGIELAEQVGALRPGIKVLFMSGYTDHAVLAQGILDPDQNFIQKPFTLDTLTRKTQELCSTYYPVEKSSKAGRK
ncbi:MAG: response regulator [Elusimicrobiales bacterium]|nr:response regulator [Elusimicrobiales bacterium]